MAHFKNLTTQKKKDKIVYGDKIVDGIVLLAVSELPFVELCSVSMYNKMRSSSINVKSTKDGLVIDIDVKIHFSQSVSNMAFKIQEAVRHDVESMTDYHIAAVNVFVKGVSFNDNDKSLEQNNQDNTLDATNNQENNNEGTKEE